MSSRLAKLQEPSCQFLSQTPPSIVLHRIWITNLRLPPDSPKSQNIEALEEGSNHP
jgi:hypothetical protein